MNKKIVVIDDEPSVQEVVRAYLEGDGYLVYVAASGSDGLALAERMKPGLIVLDLMLPDISGEEICREIHPSARGYSVLSDALALALEAAVDGPTASLPAAPVLAARFTESTRPLHRTFKPVRDPGLTVNGKD